MRRSTLGHLAAHTIFTIVAVHTASGQQRDTVPIPPAIQAAYSNGTRDRNGAPGQQYWQIWPEYDLVARLYPDSAVVHGSGTVTFSNTSNGPQHEIVLLALRQGRWGKETFQIAQWYPRLAMFDDLAGWDVTAHDG